jgi:chromate reductase
MSHPVRLLGLSGSLRKESFATAILKTLAEKIEPQALMIVGDIGALPHYNQDLDGDVPPPAVAAMRAMLADSHGLVIASPEYNHGMPGVLKNAIDWLSSPPLTSALIGKHTLIITSSPAFTGGVRAQAQLRESLIAAQARPLITGEVVIPAAHTKIVDGRLTHQDSLDFALKALTQLVAEGQAAQKDKKS